MQSFGYRELIDYLYGKHDLNTAIELLKRNTRRYAKRQLTWFSNDLRIQWINLSEFQSDDDAIKLITQSALTPLLLR